MPSFRRAVALLLSVTPGALAAQSPADAEPGKPAVGPHVVVIGRPSPEPGSADLVPAERLAAPAADGADLLRQVNGVSAGRMGGRGLEPVVRGQSQNRVNVLLDGAFVFGACPNRMDPPTAFAAVDTWERVTVVKGVRSLLHGPGGSGGTVLFERDAAPAAGGWSFEAGAAGTNNGTDRDLLADLGWRSGATFARGRLQSARAGSYEDGDGATVRSAYDEDAATLAFGFAPSAGSSLEVSWDATRARDVLYAGAGMDAPEEDASTWRIGYEMPAAGGVLSFDAWRADVDHLMDNYSNRPLTAPMAMRVPSTSATTGARLQADVPAGDGWSLTVGVDFLDSNREAVRYQGPAPGAVTLANSLMWPDVTVRQTGLVVQGERPVGPGTLLAGLRYDHVDADAARAAEVPGAPMAMSPDQLYAMYYGRRSGDENEDNVSALVTWEQPLAAGTTLFAGASRTVRTADATERYLAANNPRDPTQRWIGNPGIAPETHRQADLGLAWRGGAW